MNNNKMFNKNGKRICDGAFCRRWSKLYIKGDKYYCRDHLRDPTFIRNKYKRNTNIHKIALVQCQAHNCENTDSMLYNDHYFCMYHIKYIKDNTRICDHPKCFNLDEMVNITELPQEQSHQRYLIQCFNSQYCVQHYELYYYNYYIFHITELNSGRQVCYYKDCKIESKNHHKCNNNVNLSEKCCAVNCGITSSYQGAWKKMYCEYHYLGNVCNYTGCKNTQKLTYKYKAWYCGKHLIEKDHIRNKIDHTGNVEEIEARLNELKIRKDKDNAHIYYYIKLKHNKFDITQKND